MNYSKIEFQCIGKACDSVIVFSIGDIEQNGSVCCVSCKKNYSFHPEFVSKMRKFSRLIEAVQDAKDILGDTNVAIKVKDQEIKVPYRLLLTRMNTLIMLKMEDGEMCFRFRVEPLNEQETIR